MTSLSGLAFAISISPTTAQEQTFAPVQLEVKQPMLFGQADSTFLEGGISDTIRGALLQTIQQKNGPRAKPSYAPRYEILQPRIAPDLSGQLAIASSKFVPELKARTGGIFDLPLKKLDAQIELQQKSNTSLEGLTPRVDDHLVPFDLTAKRDEVQWLDLKPRSPGEAPVLASVAPTPTTIPDIARQAPVDLRWVPAQANGDIALKQKPREVEELQPAPAQGQDLELTIKTQTAIELTAAQPQVAMDLTPARATSLQLPPQMKERKDTAVELLTKPQPQLKLKPQERPREKQPEERTLKTKAKLQPVPRIEPMAARPQTVKVQQPKVKSATAPKLSKKEQEKIEWDTWYDRVGRLCDERLVKELEKCGYPSGTSTVLITISNKRQLGVRAVNGNNEFIEAARRAYCSLDGDPLLTFPQGSTRELVEFQVTSRQSDEGPIVEVEGKRITGDTEIITKTK